MRRVITAASCNARNGTQDAFSLSKERGDDGSGAVWTMGDGEEGERQKLAQLIRAACENEGEDDNDDDDDDEGCNDDEEEEDGKNRDSDADLLGIGLDDEAGNGDEDGALSALPVLSATGRDVSVFSTKGYRLLLKEGSRASFLNSLFKRGGKHNCSSSNNNNHYHHEHNQQQRDDAVVIWSRYEALGPECALDSGMTRDFAKVMSSQGAGCNDSSQLSEALSAEILHRVFQAQVTHCEMEIKYTTPSCPKLDFRCVVHDSGDGEGGGGGDGACKLSGEVGGGGERNEAVEANKQQSTIASLGVSVTRAVPSSLWSSSNAAAAATPPSSPPTDCSAFTRREARALVLKKLRGLSLALEHGGQFEAAVLHVWCATARIGRLIEAELRAVIQGIRLLAGRCRGGGKRPDGGANSALKISPRAKRLLQISPILDRLTVLLTVTDFGVPLRKLRYTYLYNGTG